MAATASTVAGPAAPPGAKALPGRSLVAAAAQAPAAVSSSSSSSSLSLPAAAPSATAPPAASSCELMKAAMAAAEG
jgi:hypothetical protein